MKKNYFFTLLLMMFASVSFGQIVTNGDFETWSGGVLGTWTSETGTTIEQETTITHGGANSAKFTVTTQTQGNTDFRQSINVTAGKVYDVSVWVYQTDNAARARLFFDGYQAYSDQDVLNTWQEVTYEYTATTSGTIDIGLRFYDLSSNWAAAGNQSVMYIDDFTVTEQVTTTPSIVLASPTDNQVFAPGTTSVPVTATITNFVVSGDNGSGASNGSGDGYVVRTLETVGGATETTNFFTDNLPNITVAGGASYVLKLELVNNSGASLSPAVETSVSFSVASSSQVTDLAGLRAASAGSFYEITGGVVVTYVTGNNRNQIYIQDATGGMLIDDPSGVITTSYNVGDEITGLSGELKTFQTVLQIEPSSDPGAPSATGQSFTTTSVTIADYLADVAKTVDQREYEHEFLTIQNATFDEADGTTTFDTTNTRNYNVSTGGDSMVMRINFNEADFNGNVIPQGAASITGIGGQYGGTAQVYPTEFTGIVLSAAKNNIEGFGIYPNPVTTSTFALRTASADTKNVSIFNVLGKQVLTTKVSGNNSSINVSVLNTGIYIVKVTENGKTATKKLVIK